MTDSPTPTTDVSTETPITLSAPEGLPHPFEVADDDDAYDDPEDFPGDHVVEFAVNAALAASNAADAIAEATDIARPSVKIAIGDAAFTIGISGRSPKRDIEVSYTSKL